MAIDRFLKTCLDVELCMYVCMYLGIFNETEARLGGGRSTESMVWISLLYSVLNAGGCLGVSSIVTRRGWGGGGRRWTDMYYITA